MLGLTWHGRCNYSGHNSINVMKTTKLFSTILAAGLAGVALVKFGNSSLLASLPGDKLFAIGASLALVGFAAYDYSRRIKTLAVKSNPSLRPPLPSTNAPASPAYQVRRVPAIVERNAA
jgi:hypothetical protein